MQTIKIFGASDDLIEVSGCKGADEFYAVEHGLHMGTLDFVSDGGASGVLPRSRLRVHAIYDGTWSFAVGLVEEGDKLPAWPIDISKSGENDYSAEVTIIAPADVVCIYRSREGEED